MTTITRPPPGDIPEVGVTDGDGPFCTPPTREFVLFTQMSRVVAQCLGINHQHGTFLGPTRCQVSALAVAEARMPDGQNCRVRLVGRVVGKETKPYPLIRIRWVRAVSDLSPEDMMTVLGQYYGLHVSLPASAQQASPDANGWEYFFDSRRLIPRILDSARGDSPDGPKRYSSEELLKFDFPEELLENADKTGTTTVIHPTHTKE